MSDCRVVTPAFLRDWPLPDPAGAGKDARGTVLVVGGARHTPGAALLAGVAALRAGAGKLTVATVEDTAAALAVAVPEAGVHGLPATKGGSLGAAAVEALGDLAAGADAVLVGPGLTGPDDTRELVEGLLPHLSSGCCLVLDAMALTCGAVPAAAGDGPPVPVVGTPNAKEAAYLLGEDAEALDAADPATAVRVARRLGGVVALRSTVAAPDGRCWSDGGGDLGLGTSGSGDVLAGAVTGLAARGAEPAQAAVWGVHLHAQSGERLAARVGRLGYLARELLDELPLVLDRLGG